MNTFLSLRTQYENLGDEIINSILVNELAARGQVHANSAHPPEWYISNFKRNVRNISNVKFYNSDAAFYGKLALAGANPFRKSWLFTSPGDATSRGPASSREKLLISFLMLPGIKVANVGTSFSSLSEGQKAILRSAKLRGVPTVRDRYSVCIAASAGIDIDLVPDLAWKMPRRRNDGDLAVFTLREPKIEHRGEIEATIVALVKKARAQNLTTVFVWQVSRDEAYCTYLAEKTSSGIHRFCHGRPTIDDVKSVYSRTKIVFSNRLHALLIAGSFGAIPVPVLSPDEIKVRGVFEQAQLDHLIHNGSSDETLEHTIAKNAIINDELDARFNENSIKLDAFFDKVSAL